MPLAGPSSNATAWVPDTHAQRDHLYAALVVQKLPPKADLRPRCPKVIE